MKIQDLSVCNDISEIFENKLILYGTGVGGVQIADCLKKMKKDILAVCNTYESSGKFQGYSIKSLKYIKEYCDTKDTLIVISSIKYYKEMISEYIKYDFKKAKVCTVYAFFISLWMHTNDRKIPVSFRKELNKNLCASNIRRKNAIEQYAFTMLIKAAEANENTILIYQPGKVGSQSIWNSIRDKSIQFHSIMCLYSSSLYPKDLIDYYVNKFKTKKIKIISGVREPIARDFSAFFQNSENMLWPFNNMNGNIFWSYGNFLDNSKNIGKQKEFIKLPQIAINWEHSLEFTMQKLQKYIVKNKLDEFSWFDYELKKVFNIDVFSHPFDKEKGYTIIKENNVEILLIKLENLSSLDSVIGDFINDKEYVLNSINKNDDKIYSYTYQELKSRVLICPEYYEYYYENDRLQHFYTQEEIEKFCDKWKEHIIRE